MKKRFLIIFLIITFILEIILTYLYFTEKYNYNNDVVQINELTREIEHNFGNESRYPKTYDYTIIDNNNNLIYKTNDNLSESLNTAYKNRDTIIDLAIDNNAKGKIIISNNFEKTLIQNKKSYIIFVISISSIQLFSFVIYYIYIYINYLKPFKKMEKFASRISSGNLDIPLNMDRHNNFGAFTEAFDIMRQQIKKSRESEKAAIESKKELVAKLSHDIKTPIASIKSSSELGIALSKDEKIINYFQSINNKSDQVNTLINNLFSSTLEELEELKINPSILKSSVIKELIDNADYLNKNTTINIPECSVYADRLRLQQIFDNIFANSYKYANTDIETEAVIKNEHLIISIKDFGNTIKDEELPLLTEKFKRGSNTENIDGVGLGLYISKELLRKMNGNLEIENCKPGFKVIIYLRII